VPQAPAGMAKPAVIRAAQQGSHLWEQHGPAGKRATRQQRRAANTTRRCAHARRHRLVSWYSDCVYYKVQLGLRWDLGRLSNRWVLSGLSYTPLYYWTIGRYGFGSHSNKGMQMELKIGIKKAATAPRHATATARAGWWTTGHCTCNYRCACQACALGLCAARWMQMRSAG
jgi:hypothetical protein